MKGKLTVANQLLGIDLFEADPDVIDTAANKQMSHIQGCAMGPHLAASQKLLNEIAAARLALLDPKKKAAYDAKLKATLAAAQPKSNSVTPSAESRDAENFGRLSPANAKRPNKPEEVASKKWMLIGIGGVATVAIIGGILIFAKSGKDKQQGDSVAKVEPKTDPKVEPKTDPKVEPKTNPKVEPKTDPKVDPKVEPKTDPKDDPKVDPKIEPKVEPKAEPKTDPKVEPKADKIPAPAAEEQAKAEKVIKDIFKDDFTKAKSAAEKLALAEKLLKQGRETKDDKAARFVLFRLAADTSAQTGDHQLGYQAVEQMGKEYEVDLLAQKTIVVTTASKQVAAPAAKELTEAILQLVGEAIAADQFETGLLLAKLAESTAAKAKDIPLVTKVSATAKQVQEIQKEAETVKAVVETLKDKPDDPAANLVVGKFLCLLKNDWDKGLPLLAKGSDEKLKTLAQQDLGNPSESAAQMKLADEWFELSAKELGTKKATLGSRAYDWYRKSLPLLEGLNKAKVEKRVLELEKLVLKTTSPTESAGVVINKDGQIVLPKGWESKFNTGKIPPSYDVKTGILKLTYDFSDAKQLKDFEFDKDTPPKIAMNVLTMVTGTEIKHAVPFVTLDLSCQVNTAAEFHELMRTSEGYSLGSYISRTRQSRYALHEMGKELVVGDPDLKVEVNAFVLIKSWSISDKLVGLKTGSVDISAKRQVTEKAVGYLFLEAKKNPNRFAKLTISGKIDPDWAKDFFKPKE